MANFLLLKQVRIFKPLVAQRVAFGIYKAPFAIVLNAGKAVYKTFGVSVGVKKAKGR